MNQVCLLCVCDTGSKRHLVSGGCITIHVTGWYPIAYSGDMYMINQRTTISKALNEEIIYVCTYMYMYMYVLIELDDWLV